MKKYIKEKAAFLLFYKSRGGASLITGMFSVILTLLVLIIAIYSYTLWQSRLQTKYNLELTAHKYLMAMELADFSDQSVIDGIYAQMDSELGGMGLYDIGYSGSTVSPIQNGEKIELKITGKIRLKDIQPGSGLSVYSMSFREFEINIEKSGTAMY